MNPQEKIRHAAAATDVILEGCNRALQALQAPLVHNAAGVLADPHMVRSNLHRARAAIDMALDAINSIGDRRGSRITNELRRWRR
jgi:hypothetical protein